MEEGLTGNSTHSLFPLDLSRCSTIGKDLLGEHGCDRRINAAKGSAISCRSLSILSSLVDKDSTVIGDFPTLHRDPMVGKWIAD